MKFLIGVVALLVAQIVSWFRACGADHGHPACEHDGECAAGGRRCASPTWGLVLFLLIVNPGSGRAELLHLTQTFVRGQELTEASALAVSPDGADVYAVTLTGQLTHLSRDSTTGKLNLVESIFLPDLVGACAIVISPDGAHVYVASSGTPLGVRNADALLVFVRDLGTGSLSLVQTLRNSATIIGIHNARGLAVSPDGKHLYTASGSGGYATGDEGDDAVAVFERDPLTGTLTFLQALVNGVGGIDGLTAARSVAVSPDGLHVYVVSASVQLWNGEDAVAVFSRDGITGLLTPVEVVRNGQNGVTGLYQATDVALSPDGAHVYVVSGPDATRFGFGDNAIAVFARDGVTGHLTFVQALFDGVGGLDGLGGANSVAVSADGAQVYVTGGGRSLDGDGDSSVVTFSRNSLTGELTFAGALIDHVGGVEDLRSARSVVLSPDGKHAYIASCLDDAVVALGRDALTGVLAYIGSTHATFDGLRGAFTAAVSPDGAHVYVAGTSDNAIVTFARDALTGSLSYSGVVRDGKWGVDGINGANGLAISPDGAHVYVVAGGDSSISLFSRDAGTGALTYLNSYFNGAAGGNALANVTAVALSPDGAYVYVTAYSEDAISVFARDAGTGALTFVESVSGIADVSYLGQLTLSPDGGHVYVVGSGKVSTLARDASTGRVSFVGASSGGPAGMYGPSAVAVAPDGASVYVTEGGGAVDVFARDLVNDALIFVQRKRDAFRQKKDAFHVSGLAGARSLIVSPDGDHLYIAGGGENSLVLFTRTPADGGLFYRETWTDELIAPGGGETHAVAMSPDGRNLYVVGAAKNSITTYRFASACPPTPVAPCRAAGRATLKIADNSRDSGDRLTFRWEKGEATPPEALGDPVSGATGYTLCLYHQTPAVRIFESNAAATCVFGTCWAGTSTDVQYRSASRTPDGMATLRVHAGPAGSAWATARVSGVHAEIPVPPPLAPPVTAQILNSTGACWGATFGSQDIVRNDALPGKPRIFIAVDSTP